MLKNLQWCRWTPPCWPKPMSPFHTWTPTASCLLNKSSFKVLLKVFLFELWSALTILLFQWSARGRFEDDQGKLLRPFSVAFVKGWRRTLAAFICCEGIRKLQIPLDRIPDVFKEGFFDPKIVCTGIKCLKKVIVHKRNIIVRNVWDTVHDITWEVLNLNKPLDP